MKIKTHLAPSFAVIVALFYSYTPLIYVQQYFGIDKDLLFLVILAIALLLFTWLALTGQLEITAPRMTPVFLYIPFGCYAAASFLFHAYYLGHYEAGFKNGFVVLSFLNPIFIMLAVYSAESKKTILRVTLILSSVYFLVVCSRALTGNFGDAGWQIVVFDVLGTKKVGYQNTTLYLGLFIILFLASFRAKGWLGLGVKGGLLASTLAFQLMIGGRTAFVATLVMLGFFFYLTLRDRAAKTTALLASLSIIIIGSAVSIESLHTLLEDELHLGGDKGVIGLRRFESLLSADDQSQRGFLFSNALELFLLDAKNFLFGAGMGSYSVYINGAFTAGSYPHNIILELLAEYGTVGFLLFIAPFLYVLYLRKKNLGSITGHSRDELLVLIVFGYLLIISMATGSLQSSWRLVFFAYLLYPGSTAVRVGSREGETRQKLPFRSNY